MAWLMMGAAVLFAAQLIGKYFERKARREMTPQSTRQEEQLMALGIENESAVGAEADDNLRPVSVGELEELHKVVEPVHEVRQQKIIKVSKRVH